MVKKKEHNQQVDDLKNLQVSPWWDLVVNDVLKRLEDVESLILTGMLEDFNTQKYTQWDIERVKRAFLLLLKDYPEVLIEKYDAPDELDEDDWVRDNAIDEVIDAVE